jgi:inner membrane transporter RhtA
VPSPALVVAGIASVQFGAALAIHLFAWVGSSGAVLLRLVAASIVLVAIARPRLSGHSRRALILAVLFGLVLAGMNLAFYAALHRIPLGIAVALEFVGPLSVAIAGSRRPVDAIWVLLAAGGILALTHGGTHHLSGLGVFFALFAGGLWACYILLSARVGQAFERGSGLALAMCVATVAALPFGIASGGTHLLEPRSLAVGAAVGILSSAIPYSFELEALRRLAAHVFGILMSLEPGMAALAGFLVLGQGLSARALLGLALVIAASVGVTRRGVTAPIDG